MRPFLLSSILLSCFLSCPFSCLLSSSNPLDPVAPRPPPPAPALLFLSCCLLFCHLTFLLQGVTPSSIVPPHRTRDTERYGFRSRSLGPFTFTFIFFLFFFVLLLSVCPALPFGVSFASVRTGSSLKPPPASVPFSLRVSPSWSRLVGRWPGRASRDTAMLLLEHDSDTQEVEDVVHVAYFCCGEEKQAIY